MLYREVEMYDIQFFRPSTKEMAVAVLVSVVLLVGAFCFGYCIGIRNVSDNGAGTEPIGNELGQAGTAISDATIGIQEAQGTADQIGGTITDAQGTADYINGTATESTELIRQSKSIIERIRSRGKT